MPYESTNELPESVKGKLSGDKLKQFKEVVNAQLGAGKSESVAFASAWAAVEKRQIDVINDIPSKVRAKIPSKDGKQIWMAAYKQAFDAGAGKEVSAAMAWRELASVGYAADADGEWRLQVEQDMGVYEKFMKWLKGDKGNAYKDRVLKELSGKEFKGESHVPTGGANFNYPPQNDWSIDAIIEKLDTDHRLVYAWASIIEEDGSVLVDKQGDMILEKDLVDAAHEFVSKSRESHGMHEGVKKGEVVESMVFTEDVQKALGIDLGKVGWFVVMKIHDDDAWKNYKNGTWKMLSVGGRAKREEVNDD